jgi:hypothetical protein
MLYLRVLGPGTVVGTKVDWDALMVHQVAADTDPTLAYFDGDTPATGSTNYYWNGTRWASASVAEAVTSARNIMLRSSFEDGAITGWQTVGTAPITAAAWSNSTDLAAVVPGHSQGGLIHTQFAAAGGTLQNVTANRPPVVVGKFYALSAYARGVITSPTAGSVQLRGAYLNSSNAIIAGTQVDGPATPLTALWKRIPPFVMPAAPAGAVTLYVAVIWTPGPVPANQYVDLSMFMAEQLDAANGLPSAFFDGDSAATAAASYAWTGTVRNSASSRSAGQTSFAPDVAWLDLYGVVYP